tara:strand:+ start:255 stop:659 length:405 start_codon:yes stop_codon:yes gene_type:complete
MSTILVNTLTGTSTAGSIAVTGEGNSTTTNLQQGLAKHFCIFDGTGTAAVDDSFNNSSITDNGTGRYAVTVTNAFTNIHFVFTGSTVGNEQAFTYINTHSAKKTTSTVAFRCVQYDGNFFDMDTVDLISHGDLA